MHSCRPQGATLRKVRSLKHTEIRPSDDISYVLKKGLPRLHGQSSIKEGYYNYYTYLRIYFNAFFSSLDT